MNPALSQELHIFCEQEQLQKHATLDKNPYCVYGTLKAIDSLTVRLAGRGTTLGSRCKVTIWWTAPLVFSIHSHVVRTKNMLLVLYL